MLYDRHPDLQSKRDKAFWARGYYVETIGNVTEAAIKKYIEEQSDESWKGENITTLQRTSNTLATPCLLAVIKPLVELVAGAFSSLSLTIACL